MYRRCLSLFFLLLPSIAVGQVAISAVPFLEIPPGPGLYLNYGAFTALPSDDPYASWANPAQISNIGPRVSAGMFINKTEWWSNRITYHSSTLAAGFERGRYRYGVGLMRSVFDLGTQSQTDSEGNENGTFHSEEFVNAFTVGMGVDLGVQLNSGITYKFGESRLAPLGLVVGDRQYQHAPIHAFDIGVQIVFPTPKIYGLATEASLGYAIRNIGGTVSYSHPDSYIQDEDPYPRTQNLGYSAAIIHFRDTPKGNIETFRLDVTVNVQDQLVDSRLPPFSNGRWRYTGIAGDIRFWDHIILRKSDDRIRINQGWRVNIFEMFRFGQGWMKGPGFNRYSPSSGYEIDLTRMADIAFEFRSPLNVVYTQSFQEFSTVGEGQSFRGLTISWNLNRSQP